MMVNRYKNTKLPSWVYTSSKESLIEHIQYLTHNATRDKSTIANARYRYRKAEKKVDEIEMETIEKLLKYIEKTSPDAAEIKEYLQQFIDNKEE